MSGENFCGEVSIVGGTYHEICDWPAWNAVFGSGWRAVRVFRAFSPATKITFCSVGNQQLQQKMKVYAASEPLEPIVIETDNMLCFEYAHPLSRPIITGLNKNHHVVEGNAKYLIGFGMLEASVKLAGEYVVYDPQSPTHPVSFKEQGGTANHLALVMNETEAKTLSGENDLLKIRDRLFERERCECLIIKRGANGAMVFCSKDDFGCVIPAYKTGHVWPIGSGDVFTTVFACYWFNENTLEDSALKASKAAAAYCDMAGSYENLPQMVNEDFVELKPNKWGNVYLAGPFFTLNEKKFVTDCRNILLAMGVKVFSPYHDVGEGKAEDVAPKDIDALNACDCVFAIVDGLDSGTLFEIGYAVAKDKKVVAYVENETDGALKMLQGTGCDIENDFTTAIYKTCWYATE